MESLAGSMIRLKEKRRSHIKYAMESLAGSMIRLKEKRRSRSGISAGQRDG